MPRLFLPNARQAAGLLVIVVASLGAALYFRYRLIEPATVGLACEAGLQTQVCLARQIVIVLFSHSVFGLVAVAAALINLIRPSMFMFALALAAGACGVVLYESALSGLAIPLVMLSLARPARARG